MKTMTTGLFVGDLDPVLCQKIENAYLRTKARVIEQQRHRHGLDPIEDGGGCMYWAVMGAEELDKEGVSTMIQGGTMMWRIVDKEKWNAVPSTQMFNFGYEFTYDNPVALIKVMDGGIPEMHVWLAIDDTNTIIDFSTGGLYGHQQHALPESKWMTPKPPPYLVVRADDYEQESMDGHFAYYQPDAVATVIAVNSGRKLITDELENTEFPSCLKVPEGMETHVETVMEFFVQKTQRTLRERGSVVQSVRS